MALRSKAASKTEYNSRPFTKSNLAGRSFCLGVMPIPCPHFKITMQLRHDEKNLDERFASMRELHRRGKTPDPEHYEVTYYADLPAMWQDVPNNEILEELFQMFNLSRPQDFEGHSLSVSDVIALKRNGEISVHYVDSIGFKELPGFLDKQPERPSVLMNLKEKCDAPECNPTVCRKVRAEHEL